MTRRLLIVAALFSLPLCLATAALWTKSYKETDELMAGFWSYRHHPHYENYYDAWELNAFNDHGQLKLRLWLCGCVAGPGRREAFPGQKGRQLTIGLADPRYLEAADFDLARADRTKLVPGFRYRSTARVLLVVIPHPAAVGFTALLPLLAAADFIRRRRLLQPGLCPVCRYDLRASRDRCPECGTQIERT